MPREIQGDKPNDAWKVADRDIPGSATGGKTVGRVSTRKGPERVGKLANWGGLGGGYLG